VRDGAAGPVGHPPPPPDGVQAADEERPDPSASWPPPGLTRRAAYQGVDVQVVVAGTGPVLLALHGSGASSHSFRRLLPQLTPRFTVVAPDLPGHGGSRRLLDPSRFEPSLPGIAAAVGALLPSLGLGPPRVALGHSAGAAVVFRMVLDGSIAPELVVGVAAAVTPFRGLPRLVFPISARWLARSGSAARMVAWRMGRLEQVDKLIRGVGSVLERTDLEAYRRLVADPRHVAGVLRMMAAWDLEPLHQDLPSLDTEVLLVAGERDEAVPVAQQRAIARRLPRAVLEVVPGAGHLVHEERPEAVAALLLGRIGGAVPDVVSS